MHQHAPDIFHGQVDIIVLAEIRLAYQKAEIDQALVQLFHDPFRVTAVNVVMDQGMFFLEILGCLCQKRNTFCFSAADIDFPVDIFMGGGQFGFCLFHQVN